MINREEKEGSMGHQQKGAKRGMGGAGGQEERWSHKRLRRVSHMTIL